MTIHKTASSAESAAPRLPPAGPQGSPLFGCMRQLRSDPLSVAMQANREYGHYVRIRFLPGFYMYLLSHPEAIEHILQKNQQNYCKPSILTRPMSLLIGKGLFTSEGDFWQRQRRLMQPAFHRQHLATLVPLMVSSIESFLREREAAEPGQVVDMLDEMMKLTLRVAGTTLFSADISGEADEIGRAYRVALECVSHRMRSLPPTPVWLPTPRNLAFAKAKQILDEVILNLIASRRKSSSRPEDLLSLLLAAQDEETTVGMTDRQVKDEVHTLLLAGHETTGAALSWTWYLLGQHPLIQNDLYDEVSGRLEGRSPALEDLPALPLTKAIFEESLRLYPPAAGQAREALHADEINGFPIPAKAIVNVCQFVTHRHPDFWEEPETFKPDRFLPGRSQDRHRFAYYPFGSGPRVCIGSAFALMEGTLALAAIIQRFRVELVPDQTVVLDATFALRPRNGVMVRLWPR